MGNVDDGIKFMGGGKGVDDGDDSRGVAGGGGVDCVFSMAREGGLAGVAEFTGVSMTICRGAGGDIDRVSSLINEGELAGVADEGELAGVAVFAGVSMTTCRWLMSCLVNRCHRPETAVIKGSKSFL
uniref:Uncharacterized protein n=1 Tax=Dikerogammarus haemobaphes virus 1 TaxID=2704946 RepID=A0A6G9HDH3_9VIRU|nr:hypothetical protein [Dikerogammarus haemobaphes virus 1]